MFDIVTPLYNKAEFVGRTIASVIAQSFSDWRLILVDDGSSDSSVAEAGKFDDPRITLIRQSNAGPGAARNTAIRAGNFDWIAFLDADDIWLPDHLDELDRLRREFSDSALIGTAFHYWPGGDTPAAQPGAVASRRRIRYFEEAVRDRPPFYTSSAAVSRRAIDQVGLLQPVMVGDEMDLWARLALHGPVAASSRPTVLYRIGTGGITDSNVGEPEDREPQLALADVSLPAATLVDRLPTIADPELRCDVSAYLDHEVGIALLHALRNGQPRRARALAGLFLGKPRGKFRMAAWLAQLPAPLGQRLLFLIFAVKRHARRIGGDAHVAG